jgi:hypothetical protein
MTLSLDFRAPAVDESFLPIGPLALIFPLLQKLRVAEIIDQHLPADPQLEFTYGKVLSLLLAARLQRPRALINVPQWAEQSGAEVLWGLPAEKLNDDRLGRSLHAFFGQRHSIMAAVTVQALQLTGLDLERLHFDPTHIVFQGAYQTSRPRPQTVCDPLSGRLLHFPGNEQLPAAHISKGYLTDRRMIQVGMTSVIDDLGAVPIFAHPLDGNRTGHIAMRENYELLQQHLPLPAQVLMISDRGTCSTEHLALLHRHGHQALCSVQWKDYRSLYDAHQSQLHWSRASFLSLEQQRRRQCNSSLPQDHYELAVLKHEIRDPRNGNVIPARVIFVHSTSDARHEKEHRLKVIAKMRAGLDAIAARAVRGNPSTTYETLARAVHKLLGDRTAAAKYFRWQLVPLTAEERAALPPPRPRYRQPTHRLEYAYDEAAVANDERYDGISALVATAERTHSCDQLFTMFKEQNYQERANHLYKGPLAVAPVFLKSPERVEALVCLMQIALQAYQVLERLYRANVPSTEPQTEKRLTAAKLLERFSSYSLFVRRRPAGRVLSATILGSRRQKILQRLSFPTPAQLLTKLLPVEPPSG